MVLGTLKQFIFANVGHRIKVFCTAATTLVVLILLDSLANVLQKIVLCLGHVAAPNIGVINIKG